MPPRRRPKHRRRELLFATCMWTIAVACVAALIVIVSALPA